MLWAIDVRQECSCGCHMTCHMTVVCYSTDVCEDILQRSGSLWQSPRPGHHDPPHSRRKRPPVTGQLWSRSHPGLHGNSGIDTVALLGLSEKLQYLWKLSEKSALFVGMWFHKSMLVARGANTQLDPSCVSASIVTNVNLFACFVECLFKSFSISYWLWRRVASDSLHMGMPYVWSIDRTACRMFGQ